METKIYPFINDLVFKCVFGQKKNAKLLICLLNAILHREGMEKIEEIEILNPFNLQEFEADKLTIVDVKARSKKGDWLSIEVQMESQRSYVARSVYYLSKLYSNQLVEGEDFTRLTRATGISILNFRLLSGTPGIQNVFRLKNRETGMELFDAFELHFIELPKVSDNLSMVPKTPFERWIHILKFSNHYCGGGILPNWANQEEGITMAMRELTRVNADKQYRALLETREKSDLVHRTLLSEARQEGREEVIQKMLTKGKTAQEICELTDIPLPDVLRITAGTQKKPGSNKVSETARPFNGKGKKKAPGR